MTTPAATFFTQRSSLFSFSQNAAISRASPLAGALRRRIAGAALLTAFAAPAYADAVGIRVGAYRWSPDFGGTVESGGERIDINRDLGIDDDDANTFFVAIEHPIPVLPNLMLKRTELDTSATQRLSRTFTFDDQIYVASDIVHTDIDLTHTDATFYYELLDNWAELDLGLTVRYFEEGVRLEAELAGESSELDLDVALPMLYVAAKFNLPLTGAYVAVDGNGVGYGGSTLFDYRAAVGYESSIGLGAELGYRSFDLDYDDDDDQADIKVDGVYASVFYHF